MKCSSIENVLDLYSERRLNGSWTEAVAAHIAGCAACAEKERRLRPEAARAATAPAGFKERLRAATATAKTTATATATTRTDNDARTAAIALAVFAAVLGLIHHLTTRVLSQKAVFSNAAPWRLP